jgi:hypothetical protein
MSTPLPTADKLARGELNRYVAGHPMAYKLKPAEWPAYEQAKEQGFLAAPWTGLARTRLRNCYFAYCEDMGRPFVCVETRERWATVELDMIATAPDNQHAARLSDAGFQRIHALFGELTEKRGARWSSGHVFAYSDGIPAAKAPWLAGRLFAIACADLRGAR